MEINPRSVDIFGYESPACLEMIISLMTGIIEKDCIPPVKLCTFDDGKTFNIPYETGVSMPILGGGHHRVLAAYLLGEDLDVEVIEKGYEIPRIRKLGLYDINLKMNPRTFKYEKSNKTYRELPDVETFFEKYSKINMALKYGTQSDYSLDRESYKKMTEQLK